MAETLETTEVEILDRIIAGGDIPEEAARSFLSFQFPDVDQQRQNYLAQRAQAGELTAAEKQEAESYMRVGHFISLLKSRARQSLTDNS